MKTGRVRKKAQPAPEPEKKTTPSKPPAQAPRAKPTYGGKGARKAPPIGCIIAPFVLFVVGIIIVIIVTSGKKADEWVEVTRASGEWMVTMTVFGPQVRVEERWETDCANDPIGTVRTGTCISKDADTYQDHEIDNYEEYAYNIYYDGTWQGIYQAQGVEFRETMLGKDDWWEGDIHYVLVEELDTDSCATSSYGIWVDDPQDSTQEMEVYLDECEVWDHVIVYERVYDRKLWCLCEMTHMVQLGQQSEQGSGSAIRWPNPNVPYGGRTERAFKGQVTFLGDDYTYTVKTDDLEKYDDYLTSQYYIGIRDGKPVRVSKNPPEK